MDASTSVTVLLGVSTFVAKHIRILPYENAESSYTQKMRFELHGYSWPYGTSISSCKLYFSVLLILSLLSCTTSMSSPLCIKLRKFPVCVNELHVSHFFKSNSYKISITLRRADVVLMCVIATSFFIVFTINTLQYTY